MAHVALTAQSRKETGKGAARTLRRQALIPAVFYGPEIDPVHLSLNYRDLEKLIRTGAGENVIIDLAIETGESTLSHRAMLKEIQLDPVKQTIMHVDLYEISLDKKIEVEVPIILTGDLEIAEGIEVLEEKELTIVTVVPPTRVEEIEPEVPAEEEEREEVEGEAAGETEEEGEKE
jgi:large subunit ribosomal protein L25